MCWTALLLPVELQAQAGVPVVRPGDEVRLVVVQALLQLVVQQLLHVISPELAELLPHPPITSMALRNEMSDSLRNSLDVCVLCLVLDPDPGGEVAGHPDVVNPEQLSDVGGPDQAAGRGGVGDVDRAQAVGRVVSILWHNIKP